jgi:hypothetical protein
MSTTESGSVHPLLVAAIKAEYIRALQATELLASAAAAGVPDDSALLAKVAALRSAYAAHPEFLSSGSAESVRQVLLAMFDSQAAVDGALRQIMADERCFRPDDGAFRGLDCTNDAGNPDQRPLNIALIGCGQMGEAHGLNAALDPTFSVTWCVDVNRETAEKLAASAVFADAPPRVSTDYKQALEDGELDAVLVLTPPFTHNEISLAALAAGKHVCCEKPMCLSMEEANEMTRAIEAMKVDGAAAPPPVFFLAYPRRFGIDDHKILSTIRTTLGQPVFYRDVWGVVKGHVSEVIHEETGGGGLLFENSHTIDSYNMTFGRPVKVFAIAVRMPLIVPMVIILQFQRKKRA